MNNVNKFELMRQAGALVDRFELVAPGHATTGRIIARASFLDAASEDLVDAQCRLEAHICARQDFEAQVVLDRGVIAVAQATLPKKVALDMWARQNERERARRDRDAATLVHLRTERNDCRAQVAADVADLQAVLIEGESEVYGLELRAARLRREAAAAASPPKQYTSARVAEVMSAARKADHAAQAAKEALNG